MKIRLLSVTLICALVGLTAVRAQDKKEEKEPQTELGAKMEKMSGAFRKIRNQIADATKNADSLAQVAILKENAEAALKLEPAKKAPDGEDQAKYIAAYRDGMKGLLADLNKLEAALKAGNNEEAAAVFAQVKKDQDDGHKAFKKKAPKKA